jgi:Holliday junction resolvase
MINSRTKGNKNERNLAKLFETWTRKKFSRTPSSGGLRWKNSQTVGDIVCTTEGHFFPFSIEAKSHREINFEHLLYLDEPKILEFWAQAVGDAQRADVKKIPILFMRYNGMPSDLHFVVLSYSVYQQIWTSFPRSHRYLQYGKDLEDSLYIIRSTTLFKSNYKSVRTLLKASDLWPRR